MRSPDTLENPISISKRERMLEQVVDSTPRREDITGPSRTSEETPPELVDADISKTSTERRRTDIEPELKPPRKSRHEQLWEGGDTLFLRPCTVHAIQQKIVLKLS
jgi:hypothetical protein